MPGGLKAVGNSGELRVGGRLAVNLGHWELEYATGSGIQWLLESQNNTDVDYYWLESGGPFTLVLHVNNKQWRWAEVELLGMNPVTVRGEGSPEIW